MSTQLDFGNTLTFNQIAELIVSAPNIRFYIKGEPGIGKSALTKALKEKLGTDEYHYAYIDVPNKDLGDISMPVMNHDLRITEYYPNGVFGLQTGKKLVIMLDEFTKGVDAVKNMLHPLLEVNNPRIGDYPIPEGSIVFLTGNLGSDGVGDNLKAHSKNRLCTVTMAKPSATEWLGWAVNNDIDPIICAWVDRFPHCMASYSNGEKENPYIFNPKTVQESFVTPRSLELASTISKTRENIDSESLIAALKGVVGEAAARDMQAFIDYQDQLPKWEAIIENPKTADVPDSVGACAVLIFGAIQRVDKKSMQPFMQYLERFEEEWQAAFCINMAKNSKQQAVAFSSRAFVNWVQKNEDLL